MATKNEAKIKFTAETGEFNDRIKQADSSLKEMRSELKLNASQMKKTGDNTETLKERQEILRKELEASRQKTQALTEKLEKAKEIFGDNSEEAKRLQTQLNNAKTAEQKIADEIRDTNEELKKQETALDKVADKAEKVGDKLTKVGKGMSVVSAGIAAVGAASIAAFNEFDEGADNVIKATGATGEQAAQLEEAYGNVASKIVGDFGDLGEAVGEINTRFGYTGKQLESASLSFAKFSEITGMDAKDAVQAVSRALNDAGIPLDEYDSLLDQLAKAGQSAGIDVATLADSLSKNGAVMRGMGFDTEETIALLAQFEVSGADASTMLTGMKRAMATWAAEGKNGNKEFAKTVEGIKSGSITASDALEIFGTRAGPLLVDAIKTGKFEYQDMLKVIKDSKGTVESTFDGTVDGGYKMELAMQNAKVALAEVGSSLSTTLVPFVEAATVAMQSFASWWSGLNPHAQNTIFLIAGVVAAIGPLLVVIGTMCSSVSKVITLVKTVKAAVAAATAARTAATAAVTANTVATTANTTAEGTSLASKVASKVATIAHTVATGAHTAATSAATAAQWLLTAAMYACPYMWVVAAIMALIAVIVVCVMNWDKLKAAGVAAWKGIKNAWGAAKGWFSSLWSGIKSGASSAWSSVKNTFSGVKSWFADKFASARDAVMNAWSRLKLKMPHIKLPHFSISGKFSLKPPSVPQLSVEWYAKGGIMTKPTIFGMNGANLMAGGEAGPEAILPIDKLQGYVATAVERSSPALDLAPLVHAIEDLASRPIDMSINGRAFAEATASDSDLVNGLRSRLTDRGLILR